MFDSKQNSGKGTALVLGCKNTDVSHDSLLIYFFLHLQIIRKTYKLHISIERIRFPARCLFKDYSKKYEVLNNCENYF